MTEIRHRHIDSLALGPREYKAGRIFLITDIQRMHFDTRRVAGNGRIDLQHVRAQDGLMALAQIERIVLHKHRAVIMRHDLQQTRERSRLPVALGAKAVAITHEELRSQSRQLLESPEVLEVRAESRIAALFQEAADAQILLELYPHRALEFCGLIIARAQRIFLLQLLVLRLDCRIAHAVDFGHEIADTVIIHRPAQTDLCLDLVALGHSHITHRIAETADLDAEAFIISNRNVLPLRDLRLHLSIAPEAVDHLVMDAQAGVDVAVLAVTMRALVQVHIVKINGCIGYVVQILRREMQQRLLQQLRAANPVLGRRKGVHPGDHTRHLVVVVYILHELRNAICRRHDALADDLIRKPAAGIELCHHILSVPGNIPELFLTIQVLAASDKPEFIILDL